MINILIVTKETQQKLLFKLPHQIDPNLCFLFLNRRFLLNIILEYKLLCVYNYSASSLL